MALTGKFTGRKAQSKMRKNKNWNGIRWVAALLPLCVAASIPLIANAQTQMEMNITAGKNFDKADKTMIAAYKKLMSKLDAKGKARLKKAQIAWIKFRDAEAEFRSSQSEGGSMHPMEESDCLTEITNQRTKELNAAYKDFTTEGGR